MAELDLTGQATLAGQVQTRITQLRNAMELRKPIWDKLSTEKKRSWVAKSLQDPSLDPIMKLSWQTYRYLRDKFFDARTDENG